VDRIISNRKETLKNGQNVRSQQAIIWNLGYKDRKIDVLTVQMEHCFYRAILFTAGPERVKFTEEE